MVSECERSPPLYSNFFVVLSEKYLNGTATADEQEVVVGCVGYPRFAETIRLVLILYHENSSFTFS